ncbi:MAG: hypothetical protein HOG80_04025 [Candidatus Marinimicrobia bacterium]|nr:hypothetical protein [Candidatus Neomarinimicrobiota bacterium]
MGLLAILDNLMIFILRKDKNATKRYIDNHPELKGKREEISKRYKALNKEWENADYLDVITGKKKKRDHPKNK